MYFFTTAFCYECLPPFVASLSMKERVKFINFNQAIQKVEFLSEEMKKDRDLVRWAYQIVCTRSFESDGDVRIVPVADMVRGLFHSLAVYDFWLI